MITYQDTLTPREHLMMENEKEGTLAAYEHQITLKRLDTEAKIELKKLELAIRQEEARLNRVPLLLLRLPILPFLGIAYIITSLKGRPAEARFWDLLK